MASSLSTVAPSPLRKICVCRRWWVPARGGEGGERRGSWRRSALLPIWIPSALGSAGRGARGQSLLGLALGAEDRDGAGIVGNRMAQHFQDLQFLCVDDA